jgi:ring-1,2-phenylacetyl-CoA epoxidase subunit PaaE
MLRKLFNKKGGSKNHKGFQELVIQKVERLTSECVKITLDVPKKLQAEFNFIPGQYINFIIEIDGEEKRRSYSICSGPDQPLAVAVKIIPRGIVSKWFNTVAKAGDMVNVSKPEGNFKLQPTDQNVVAFSAGSGITPIMSIAKALQARDGNMKLFYGNKTAESIIFHDELKSLDHINTTYFLDDEELDGFVNGRMDKETLTELFKQNVELLKADGFFLCGPEPMIMAGVETLKLFGVAKDKIHYELFTAPTILEPITPTEKSNFKGISKVTVLLDDETFTLDLKSNGKTILEALDQGGYDAPFSCRGGVCCSCKAKVLKGHATMDLNYALTDEEVENGYILTCQAHPDSPELSISYDS